MANLATYSPEDIILLMGGVYQIDGLYDGAFVSISEDDDRWTTYITADGKVTRTHNNTPIHTIKITLNSTADANSVLSTWALTDGFLKSAMIPFLIKDTNGSSVFYSASTWIEKMPESGYSTGVEGREWTIKSAGGSMTVGGNEGGASGTFATLGLVAADFLGFV